MQASSENIDLHLRAAQCARVLPSKKTALSWKVLSVADTVLQVCFSLSIHRLQYPEDNNACREVAEKRQARPLPSKPKSRANFIPVLAVLISLQ